MGHVLQNDGHSTHAEGWGSKCEHGSQPLNEMSSWEKSERAVIAADYHEYRKSFNSCKRQCLEEGGCAQGFSFRGHNLCRLPKHPSSHQSHLVPNADWDHHRWAGAAHTLRNDGRKWCCWTMDDQSNFSPPDWLHNVPQQQYCATMLLGT